VRLYANKENLATGDTKIQINFETTYAEFKTLIGGLITACLAFAGLNGLK
jgi:hypothetical protein